MKPLYHKYTFYTKLTNGLALTNKTTIWFIHSHSFFQPQPTFHFNLKKKKKVSYQLVNIVKQLKSQIIFVEESKRR